MQDLAVGVGGDNAETNPWGVEYGALTPLLVKGVQEQQELIDTLTTESLELEEANAKSQAEIEQLKAQNQELEARLRAIEEMLSGKAQEE